MIFRIPRFARSLVSIAALSSVAGLAHSLILYRVTVLPTTGMLHVSITFQNENSAINLQSPTWEPGAYVTSDFFKGVQNIMAHDSKGRKLTVSLTLATLKHPYTEGKKIKIAEHSVATWAVEKGTKTVVEYDIKSPVVDGAMHWGGAATYLYEIHRRHEVCKLEIRTPPKWPIYTGLDEVKHRGNVFTAPDYDTLADNPVTTGAVLVDQYLSRGKPHTIVLRGASKGKVDRAHLLKACKFISDAETDFFGKSAPYKKYVWHFSVYDAPSGGGGLEHLSSTQISLAAGVGPSTVGVLAHEFFHLWNVKRIRSRVLGPFDYTKLPKTGALWWLEGVTDYYAHTLLHRYGWTDDAAYFTTLASNFQSVRQNPAYRDVGPYESSLRVDEASSGRGNSGGYRISYYSLGWIAGVALDIEIRAASKGKHSLDDVELALWRECKNGRPGFAEDEIRRLVVRFGGTSLGAYYDRVVMKAGDDAAVDEALSKVGLAVALVDEILPDLGFIWSSPAGSPNLKVLSAKGPSDGKVMADDAILAVNGKAMPAGDAQGRFVAMRAATSGLKPGDQLKLHLLRAGKEVDVEFTVGSTTRKVFRVNLVPTATPQQVKLRRQWLAAKSIASKK